MTSARFDVLVIGGGVIGLACARALLAAGRSVCVVEKDSAGAGASRGNCGLVTPSHALPLTSPETLREALRSFLRPAAPLRVRPRLDLGLLVWGLRFARHCNRADLLAAMRGRAALLDASRTEYATLAESGELACEWETLGLLEVFATDGALRAAEPAYTLLAEHGIRSEALDRDALAAREPALREGLAGGRWFPGDAQLRPELLVDELARSVREGGGTIEEGLEVSGFLGDGGGGTVRGVRAGGRELEAGGVVLANGAWSPRLARVLGVRLPVQPGKGYSITTTRPEPCPRLPLVLREAGMAVTPWPSGYRLGGTMELAGYDPRLRRARLDALRAGARRYLREPVGEGAREWCGWRPMSSDELPIIDRAPRHGNVVIATGHGMMGVSMAPATGRLVAELVTGAAPSLDPGPYRIRRQSPSSTLPSPGWGKVEESD